MDYNERQIFLILENELRKIMQEYGAPIPIYYIRIAINNEPNLLGDSLFIPNDIQNPPDVFFQKLRSQIRTVYIELASKGINLTKQELDNFIKNISVEIIDFEQK